MAGEKGNRRPTLTRGWRALPGDKTDGATSDEFVEQAEPPVPAPTAAGVPVVVINEVEADIEFHRRVGNWRRTVCGSLGGGGEGYCAGWARLYVAKQMEKETAAKLAAGTPLPPAPTRVSVDALDGWLMEAAMRALPDYNQRKALQYWYVFQYPEHWIKSKLMLRAGAVRLVLGRAQLNLKNILRQLDSAANILPHNLHAGVDPRPESKDAPEGSASPLESKEALID